MNKEIKYFIVYKTTNLKNDKFYIGVHETFNLDDGYLGSGKVIRNSIYYHGKINFKREILEFCNDRKKMFKREKDIVTEELIKNPKCMNLKVGGEGGTFNVEHLKKIASSGGKKGGKVLSDRLKSDKNLLEAFKKQGSENFKKAHKEGKIKYSTFTGKKHTEKSKIKISLSKKGKGVGPENSQYNTMWINNGKLNKKIKKTGFLPIGWVKGRKF